MAKTPKATPKAAPKRQPVRQPVHETVAGPLPGQQPLPGMPLSPPPGMTPMGPASFGYAKPQVVTVQHGPADKIAETTPVASPIETQLPSAEAAPVGGKRKPRKKAGEQPAPASNGNGNGHDTVVKGYVVELRGTVVDLLQAIAKEKCLTEEQCITALVEGAVHSMAPKEKAPLVTENSGRPSLFTEDELMASTMRWLAEQQAP